MIGPLSFNQKNDVRKSDKKTWFENIKKATQINIVGGKCNEATLC